MKPIVIISILVVAIFTSCNQKADIGELLDNSETRSEIFEAIASDHNQLMLFMESMQSNEHAMQMMQGDQMMMGNMMKGNGIHTMMKDSVMMHQMMENMLKDKKTLGNMMQMMHTEGMMSNECMQATMKSMNGMVMMH